MSACCQAEMVDAKSGAAMIAAERERQITAENYAPEHDDQHRLGEIAMAAAVYAAPEDIFVLRRDASAWAMSSTSSAIRGPGGCATTSEARGAKATRSTPHASAIS